MTDAEFQAVLEEYSFDLPEDLIARHPPRERDAARLLLVDPVRGEFREESFRNLPNLLQPRDCLVLNRSKVSFRRLHVQRRDRTFEPLFCSMKEGAWRVLVYGAAKLKTGDELRHESGRLFKVIGRDEDFVLLEPDVDWSRESWEDFFERFGRVPIPPYFGREDNEEDRIRYRTIYGQSGESLAAPTAGLHFTQEILDRLALKQIDVGALDLHVGFGTFAPLKPWNFEQHRLHLESFEIDDSCATAIENASRVIAVGTTTARALESVTRRHGKIQKANEDTDLFIFPPDSLKSVQGLITNFHLPSSSLFMLVCAFGGRQLMHRAYQFAIEQRFRFFSYGDAMMILPGI